MLSDAIPVDRLLADGVNRDRVIEAGGCIVGEPWCRRRIGNVDACQVTSPSECLQRCNCRYSLGKRISVTIEDRGAVFGHDVSHEVRNFDIEIVFLGLIEMRLFCSVVAPHILRPILIPCAVTPPPSSFHALPRSFFDDTDSVFPDLHMTNFVNVTAVPGPRGPIGPFGSEVIAIGSDVDKVIFNVVRNRRLGDVGSGIGPNRIICVFISTAGFAIIDQYMPESRSIDVFEYVPRNPIVSGAWDANLKQGRAVHVLRMLASRTCCGNRLAWIGEVSDIHNGSPLVFVPCSQIF